MPPDAAIRFHAQMPLEFLGRHPSFALHDIKHRLDPEQQGDFGSLEDGPHPQPNLTMTFSTRTEFWPGSNGLKGLSLTRRTLKLGALESTLPEQRPSLGFDRDFRKEPLRSKRFIEHLRPPLWGTMANQKTAFYHEMLFCALS